MRAAELDLTDRATQPWAFGVQTTTRTRSAPHARGIHGGMSAPQDEQPPKGRDLMAPDTEPTDEELEVVMRDALALARKRREIGDAWVAARLEEATRHALEQREKERGAR
jgi:hypothetical protein